MSPIPRPLWERCRENILFADEEFCWRWIGHIGARGYGMVWNFSTRKPMPAHRAVYEHFRGPIPEGLAYDHLCRHRWCVNPEHGEPVTTKENCLRGESLPAQNARKTQCPMGHSSEPKRRRCLLCRRHQLATWRSRHGRHGEHRDL